LGEGGYSGSENGSGCSDSVKNRKFIEKLSITDGLKSLYHEIAVCKVVSWLIIFSFNWLF
jgi:hypothetical protein